MHRECFIELRFGIKYNTKMSFRIVLDTNVVVSALRSDQGASFRLLSLLGQGRFEFSLSVPLVLEYEDACNRQGGVLQPQDIGDIIDYLCQVGERRQIYFLWRPCLKDPKDDLVLELAVESGSDFIVTYNQKDFAASEKFGVRILTPKEFLKLIGECP